MRVIAGTHRGRRLRQPQGLGLRPTSERVREALFSILGNRLPRCRFLDLYAGTGAVAIEALSRGAWHATCVESDPSALKLLRQNVHDCAVGSSLTIYAQTVERFLSRPDLWEGEYDIVFADPPYTMVAELTSIFEHSDHDRLLAPDSWFMIEHAAKTKLPPLLGSCVYLRGYRYGDTALSLYLHTSQTPS